MKKIILSVVICLLLLAILFPFETTSIPEWRLQVVDRLGNPTPNVKVRQHWSHGSSGTQEEDLISEADGFVVFPARTVRRPLIVRVLYHFFGKLNHIVMPHGGSTGPRAYVMDAGGARTNSPRYSEGKELENKLIRLNYPYSK